MGGLPTPFRGKSSYQSEFLIETRKIKREVSYSFWLVELLNTIDTRFISVPGRQQHFRDIVTV